MSAAPSTVRQPQGSRVGSILIRLIVGRRHSVFSVLATLTVLVACTVPDGFSRGSAAVAGYDAGVALDTAGITARRIAGELSDLGPSDFSILPDGNSRVEVDWEMGNLVLVDHLTGARRDLTPNVEPYALGEPQHPIVSPDGSHVAYFWWDQEVLRPQLRVLRLAGGEPRVLIEDPREWGWIEPKAWSPDGRTLVVQRALEGGLSQIVMLPAVGGPMRVIRTLDWRWESRAAFTSDGDHLLYHYFQDTDSESRDIHIVDLRADREHTIVGGPSNDALIGSIPGTDAFLFSSDRTGTPGVWMQRVEGGRALGNPVLVRPDFWRASAGGFTADGRLFYSVLTQGRNAFVADFDLSSRIIGTPQPILDDAVVYGGSIRPPRWAPDGRSISVLIEGSARLTLLVRPFPSGETRTYAIPQRLTYLTDHRWYRKSDAVLVTSLPNILGAQAFRVDLATNRTERVLELRQDSMEFVRVIDVMPDGESVLVWRRTRPGSGGAPRVVTIHVMDLSTGIEREIFRNTGVPALALSPDGLTLVATGAVGSDPSLLRAILIPTSGQGEGDRIVVAREPTASASEWIWDLSGFALLRIEELVGETRPGVRSLFRFPLDGAAPSRTQVVLPHEDATDVSLSPTGDRIAYASGTPARELWVLDGLPELARRAGSDR